jgi:hypothetical protein
MATEDIFVNVNGPTLASARVVSSTNNQTEAWRKFVIADLRDLNLYFTDGAGAYVDVSGYTDFRVGVGGINKRPTGGTWEFSHGGNDNDFAYDVSAPTMEATLDASPFSLGVSVTSPVGGVWIVKFDAVGAQTLPTTDASALTPDGTVSVKRLVTGDGSTKEEWIIRNFQVPWAYSESWSSISNGVTGSLNFGTENLYKAMGDADSLAGYFEIELTDGSANISTVVQAPVTVQGPVIGDGVAGAGAFSSYLTQDVETIICSVTSESETLSTGTGKITWQMPYAMTLTAVRASVKTAGTGSTIIVDLNEGGSSVLSTKVTIDAGETSSKTAAIPPVISDSDLADDGLMTIDIDQVGSGTAGVGLKLYLTGTRA